MFYFEAVIIWGKNEICGVIHYNAQPFFAGWQTFSSYGRGVTSLISHLSITPDCRNLSFAETLTSLNISFVDVQPEHQAKSGLFTLILTSLETMECVRDYSGF